MMGITINEIHREKDVNKSSVVSASEPMNQVNPQILSPSFFTACPFCRLKHRFLREYIAELVLCNKCKKRFVALELEVRLSSLQQQTVPSTHNNTRCFDDDEDVKPMIVGEKRKRNEYYGESCDPQNQNKMKNEDVIGSRDAVTQKISECSGPKFNDFDKLRGEANLGPCQAWALYDPVDGMPRQYAIIRKALAPGFGVRITYLEPDPVDEKEIQWFEEDLPVSVGKFRLGKNQNMRDRSKFSHHVPCQDHGIIINNGHIIVSPREGETWALFKNWDINWSSEPDSHRKYEFEFVEILSDYTDGAGVSVAFLHKAKGFASVFFRMDAEKTQILPRSLYRFSHRIPSFKMKRVDIKGVPKDAYELDQAALPETIEERIVPSHLYAEPKPKALCFSSKGKVFQTGQIWSFYSGDHNLPLYYCRIHKITLTQAFEEEAVFKLHVSRLKATPFPENVIRWEDKRMPIGCGTFAARRINGVLTTDDVSHQIVPETSIDGNEYTVLPKIGDVWAIYRSWTCHKEFKDLSCCDYDIVEVVDDTLDYNVLALEHVLFSNEDDEKKTFFGAAESRHCDCDDDEDGSSKMVFTIPKSKMLSFSHQIPASRVTKEIHGVSTELFEVDSRALPKNVTFHDH